MWWCGNIVSECCIIMSYYDIKVKCMTESFYVRILNCNIRGVEGCNLLYTYNCCNKRSGFLNCFWKYFLREGGRRIFFWNKRDTKLLCSFFPWIKLPGLSLEDRGFHNNWRGRGGESKGVNSKMCLCLFCRYLFTQILRATGNFLFFLIQNDIILFLQYSQFLCARNKITYNRFSKMWLYINVYY